MEYYSLNQYLQDTFHTKVYKIPINAGFTCPNRDGTLDTRGCIFCSSDGSGDFCMPSNMSITNQIEEGKKKVASKIGDNGKYIAYFQAYTNTYAPIERLRRVYEEAINHPDIVAISIATRPDCLPKDVLDLLSELNAIKPVWVELGLQTIHEDTAKYIRRGYALNVYDESVKELKKRGLYTIVHVILGLPNESKNDMLETVDYVVKSGIDGIKLQLLHVLKNTDLAIDYNEGKFTCMSLEEYADLIVDCVRVIPNTIAIHRLTGDGAKKDLIAPLWSGDKKRVLNTIYKNLHK
jgi:radical SAM protein (TIGR01212 family)